MSTNCTTLLQETFRHRVVKVFFLALIFLAAIFLNLKTFVVLLKRKRHRRNVVTLFLLNLTLVSALMVCQIPFNIHAAMKQEWIFGDGFCQFNGFSNVFLCMDQIFTLLCLTIDRYLAVIKPLKHRYLMTRQTAYKMLAVVYFLSFLLAIEPIFGKARYKYHAGTNHCSPSWRNSCGYAAAMTIVAFIIPTVGMLITYTRIFLTLRSKRVLMSKRSTLIVSSRDTPSFDMDSNSLGGFEDASTDPSSSETEFRLAALKIIADSKRGVQEYGTKRGPFDKQYVSETASVSKDTKGTISAYKITGDLENDFEKSDLDTCVKSDHLPVEHTTHSKTTGKSKEAFVDYPLKSSSTSKQQLTGNESPQNDQRGISDHVTAGDQKISKERALATSSSDEMRLTREESSENHKKFTVNTGNGDRRSLKNKGGSSNDDANKIRIRYINVTGEDVNPASTENLEIRNDVENSDSGTERLPRKPESCVGDTDDESSVLEMGEGHGAVKNKHVSFGNALEVEVGPSKERDGKRRRLSGFLHVPRSCKAITDLVIARMKKQRAIRHEFKIARTGTMLVLSFIILWMPYAIAHSCIVGACRTMTFYNIAMFLVYSNALANPIIYALTNKAVMQDIRKSMGRFCR